MIVYHSEDKVCKAIRFYIPFARYLILGTNTNKVNLISSIPSKGNIVAAYYLQITNKIFPLSLQHGITSLYVYYVILVYLFPHVLV